MLSEKLLKSLNVQMNYEFESAHIYLAMAAYCSEENLDGFANFFVVQAEEERFHAMKLYDFINKMDERVLLGSLSEPKNNFESIIDVFKAALNHEKSITKRIYNLMDVAIEEREHATISLLKWYIDEQVEEESSMKAIMKKLEKADDNIQHIYILDKELGQRTFTQPAQ